MASKKGSSSPSQTGRRPRFQPPQMRRHAKRREARVGIDGRRKWLGPWEGEHPSPEAQAKFNVLLEEWHRRRKGDVTPVQLPSSPPAESATPAEAVGSPEPPVIGVQLTGQRTSVAELVAAYVDYAEKYYQKPDGTQTSSIFLVRRACAALTPYFHTPADAFGPLKFSSLVEKMAAEGRLCRKTINATAKCIRRIFGWGVSRELVPGTVHHALRAVPLLKKGRQGAKDYEEVSEVPDEIIAKTMPHLPPMIQDMVRVQRLTGARPGEICNLMAGDIDTSGDIWIARPKDHKTAYLAHSREILIRPSAQEILRKYLPRVSTLAIFCPREAEEMRRRQRRRTRKTKLFPSHVRHIEQKRKSNPRRGAGEFYSEHSYRRAIHRACKRGGIEKWSPNQIRHTAATEAQRKFGWDAARIVLGHSSLSQTPVYVERDREEGIKAMRELG